MLQRSETAPQSSKNCRVRYRNVFMLLGAVHNRQRVLCVLQLGPKRRQRGKMVGIPERCFEPGCLYLCGQTVKRTGEKASFILLSQQFLDFLQG